MMSVNIFLIKMPETEMIMIGAMASFILGLQFYGIKQLNKLCERVTALEVKVSNIH
jgi:hypothetical protein